MTHLSRVKKIVIDTDRGMRFHFAGKQFTNKEVAQHLDERYPRLPDGRWETPFGISFAEPIYMGEKYVNFDWVFVYDAEGSAQSNGMKIKKANNQRGGWIERQEVMHLVSHFDTKEAGFSIYAKSAAIETLESLYEVKAKLHHVGAIQWNIKTPWFSCTNNPFDTCHAYAGSDSDFEVFFYGDAYEGQDPLEYVHIDKLLVIFSDRGLIPLHMVCQSCRVISLTTPLRKCTRCKVTFYCSKECQTKDWLPNHKAICK